MVIFGSWPHTREQAYTHVHFINMNVKMRETKQQEPFTGWLYSFHNVIEF